MWEGLALGTDRRMTKRPNGHPVLATATARVVQMILQMPFTQKRKRSGEKEQHTADEPKTLKILTLHTGWSHIRDIGVSSTPYLALCTGQG